MQFTEMKNSRLGESYFTACMENGLRIAVYPMPDKKGAHAMLSAKIGAVTRCFMLGDREITAPYGTAHFLEHKLFENETEDAFALFAKTGADANAYTGYGRTSYVFNTSINVGEALRILIRNVCNPIFSAASVDKERDIIAQELKMYQDNPEWELNRLWLSGLYVNHPLHTDIGGTLASIAEITPEILLDCYHAFYRPSNMVLSVAGNVDIELVGRICQEEYAALKPPSEPVTLIAPQEPETVASPHSERAMSVFENLFGLAYKEKPLDPVTRLRDEVAMQLLLDVIAGDTSELYRKLYDSGLINDQFEADLAAGDDYFFVLFCGQSRDPEAVFAAIREEIIRIRREGIDTERFEECRRAALGNELCAFDDPNEVAGRMTAGIFKNYGIYDIIETTEKLTCREAEELLERTLKEKTSATAIIRPV